MELPSIEGMVHSCSFQATYLHPEYESIKAECDAWLLSFVKPESQEAASFWVGCAFPVLGSIAYAQCPAQRVISIVKLLAWHFISDDDDDDPSVLGCETDANVIGSRHDLILACHSATPRHNTLLPSNSRVTNGLPALSEIWKEVSKDMPERMQARFVESIKAYLNASIVQARYRRAGCLPIVDEYVKDIRRPTSLVIPALILLEYGLGIELDEEALGNHLLQRLVEAVVDHVALFNDVISCRVEMARGDFFNMPSILISQANPGRLTFVDAMQETIRRVHGLDELCVRLMAEVQASPSLIEKPGVRAYLEGLASCIAGSVAWFLKSARYSNYVHGNIKENLMPLMSHTPVPFATS